MSSELYVEANVETPGTPRWRFHYPNFLLINQSRTAPRRRRRLRYTAPKAR